MSQYKPYPAYKDSGVEWLGRVPEHWEVKSIRWLSPVRRGASPRPIDDPKYFDEEGTYGWVRIEDVTASDGVLKETKQRLSSLGATLSVKLQPGALFLSIAGSVGKPCVAGFEVCIHDGFVYFPMLMSHVDWLFKIFESRTPFTGLGKLGTQLNLNTETVGSIKVGLPPAGEALQTLSNLNCETARIDALIEKKTRFIELLREKRQALITHAVTKGLDPNVKMKNSGVEWLGEVPEHWELSPLKRLVSSIGQGWSPECEARVPEDGEWGVLKVGCVNGGIFRPEESKALPSEMEPRPELGLKTGDVLVSRANTRELVGSCAVVPHDYPRLLLCDKLYRIGCSQRVTPDFLAALVAVYGRRSVEIEATGASSSMVNIAQSVILDLVVAFPCVSEQIEIISRVSFATARLEMLRVKTEHSITLLKERRSALITAAVTGQIDLRKAL